MFHGRKHGRRSVSLRIDVGGCDGRSDVSSWVDCRTDCRLASSIDTDPRSDRRLCAKVSCHGIGAGVVVSLVG